MGYSEHRFRRIVAEETKPLEQMASYIHQNTDMKLYLFLTLDDYAELWMTMLNLRLYKNTIVGGFNGLSTVLK